jgi:hypothetical protein
MENEQLGLTAVFVPYGFLDTGTKTAVFARLARQ